MARPSRPGARQSLLSAARVEFGRRGLDGARVGDITRRAGMSKGAFYLHFRTKEDAFGELLTAVLGALEKHALRRHRDEEGSYGRWKPEALGARLAFDVRLDLAVLETLWRNRQLLSALDTAGAANLRLVQGFRARVRSLVADRLRDQQRSGVLRADVGADTLVDMVVGAYEAFARRMVELEARPDLEGWARSFQLVFYGGVFGAAALPRSRSTERAAGAARKRLNRWRPSEEA